MNSEPFGQHEERIYSSHTLLSHQLFSAALRMTFAGFRVNARLWGHARARRWTALSIQTDDSTLAAVIGRRAHSHCEALSSAAFVADKVWRSHSSNGEDSLDAHQYMEWWSPCIYRRNQNDSSPLELWLCLTFRRHSEGASARKGGTLAASYLRVDTKMDKVPAL